MADSQQEHGRRKPIGGELIIPAVAVVFSIYYLWTIVDVPFTAQASALFVGTILIFLCVALFIRTALALRRGEVSLGIGGLIEPTSFVPRRLVLLGLTVAYIFVVPWLGFTLTTFLFLALAMTVLNGGRSKGFIAALSAVLAIGGWLLFVVAFETRFPAGPFEMLMQRIF
jgi:hypothetical protein